MMRPGIFAKTFARPSLEGALDAVVAAGVEDVQFNLALLGGESLPETISAAPANAAMAARGLTMAAVSGTYNMAHPDPATRERGRRRLATLIAGARELGTTTVTVCTGTRDADRHVAGAPRQHDSRGLGRHAGVDGGGRGGRPGARHHPRRRAGARQRRPRRTGGPPPARRAAFSARDGSSSTRRT